MTRASPVVIVQCAVSVKKDCYMHILVVSLLIYFIHILAVPSPPSNLSVTHLSLTSVNVSWSPAPQDDVDIDGYIIYYQLVAGGSKRTHRTESTATSIIRSLKQGGEYSFSMVSTNNGIPSTEIGPLNISIGMYDNIMLQSLYIYKPSCPTYTCSDFSSI